MLQDEVQSSRMEVGVYLQTSKEEEIDLGKPVQEPHQPRGAKLRHHGMQVIPERRLAQSG